MTDQKPNRFQKIIELIDTENKKDIHSESVDNKVFPKEYLYSIRMTETLNQYYPEADELMHIAARGQHIQRWAIARSNYPEGKLGYHEWRNALSELHITIISDLMRACDYATEDISSVASMLTKKNIRKDNNAQTIQDVVSLVFLKYYALEFAEKHNDKNIEEILAKVLRKMTSKCIKVAIDSCPVAISDAIKNILA